MKHTPYHSTGEGAALYPFQVTGRKNRIISQTLLRDAPEQTREFETPGVTLRAHSDLSFPTHILIQNTWQSIFLAQTNMLQNSFTHDLIGQQTALHSFVFSIWTP